MKLYTYFRSSASWRVRIAMALKGLAYDPAYVNLLAGEHKNDAYAGLNPQKLVPALLTDAGDVLTQSLAIIEYLEETHPQPPLLPAAPAERARARALAQAMACEIAPLCNLRVREYVQAQYGTPAMEWCRTWTQAGLAEVETLLARGAGEYCHGDTPGLADCVLVPLLANARRFGCDPAGYPLAARIGETCEKHPAFIAAHPSKQGDAV